MSQIQAKDFMNDAEKAAVKPIVKSHHSPGQGYNPHRNASFTPAQMDIFEADPRGHIDTRGLRKYMQDTGIEVKLADEDTTVVIHPYGFYVKTQQGDKIIEKPYPGTIFTIVIPLGVGKLSITFRYEKKDHANNPIEPRVMVF